MFLNCILSEPSQNHPSLQQELNISVLKVILLMLQTKLPSWRQPECWSWPDQWWPLLAAAGTITELFLEILQHSASAEAGDGEVKREHDSLEPLPPHTAARYLLQTSSREDTIDINKSIIEVEQLQLYMNVTTSQSGYNWKITELDIIILKDHLRINLLTRFQVVVSTWNVWMNSHKHRRIQT